MRTKMIAQLSRQSTSIYQTRLLSTMDLERNPLKLSLLHPTPQIIPEGLDFKAMNLSINIIDVPLSDKINLHKIG